jgi:hypothetical protein
MIKYVLVTLLYLVLFNFVVLRYKKIQLQGFKPWVTAALFNIKFATGIFIWLIYTFYYTDTANNDVHKFYNDAAQLHDLAFTQPQAFADIMFLHGDKAAEYEAAGYLNLQNWTRNFDEAPINENRTIIRLNALLMFITFKIYFAHILFMCFISLIGWVLLFNAVYGYIQQKPNILSLLVLLLPSVLFWTSGVLKEPLLVLGLGIFMYGLLSRKQSTHILGLLLGSIILLAIKFYVLACLLPAAIAFFIFNRSNNNMLTVGKYVACYVVLLLIAFNAQHITPRINLLQMLANKQMHSVKEAEYFKAGSRINIPAIEPTALSVIKTAPVGIWNTIIRPYVWEGKNPMMLASALESLVVVLIILLSLFMYNRNAQVPLNLLLFMLVFALSYFALIGICTPVLGNLVRYRAPLLPIFLLPFVLLTNWQLLGNKLPIINRLNTFCCEK